MTQYETVEINISEDAQRVAIEHYLKHHLTPESFSVFNERASELGTSLLDIQQAAGAAILNEALVEALQLIIDQQSSHEELK